MTRTCRFRGPDDRRTRRCPPQTHRRLPTFASVEGSTITFKRVAAETPLGTSRRFRVWVRCSRLIGLGSIAWFVWTGVILLRSPDEEGVVVEPPR